MAREIKTRGQGKKNENRNKAEKGENISGRKLWKWLTGSAAASYTVEAAGVMAAVFFTMMILLDQAFHMRAETVGGFEVHREVERERHAIENADEAEIAREGGGMRWGVKITSPVFRPEESLRMWSLAEKKE